MKATARTHQSRRGTLGRILPTHLSMRVFAALAAIMLLSGAPARGERPDPPPDPAGMRAAINAQGTSWDKGTVTITAYDSRDNRLFTVTPTIPKDTPRETALEIIRDALNASREFQRCRYAAVIAGDEVVIQNAAGDGAAVAPAIARFRVAPRDTRFLPHTRSCGQLYVYRLPQDHPAVYRGLPAESEAGDIKIDGLSEKGYFLVEATAEDGKLLFSKRVEVAAGLSAEDTAVQFVASLNADSNFAANYRAAVDAADAKRVIVSTLRGDTPRIAAFKSEPDSRRLPFWSKAIGRFTLHHRQTCTWSVVGTDGKAGGGAAAGPTLLESQEPTPAPGGPADTSPDGSRAAVLARVGPNPCRDVASLRFALSSAGAVTLHVFDAGGRRVCALLGGAELSAGEHLVQWNTRDDRGRPVAEGVYYCLLSALGERSQQRVLILR